MEIENVLSLFDGISCGQVALERANIKPNRYFSSEINNDSIKITQKNYPDTVQLGDIRNVKSIDLPKIDLMMAGSPCQDLSIARKGKGLQGKKSSLFYEFLRLLKELKPKYFLLENVKMKKEWLDLISKEVGVEPVLINSNLFCAADRLRYYWTNIPLFKELSVKNILLKDIILPFEEVEGKYWYKQDFKWLGMKKVCCTLNLKGHDILKRVYHPDFKCGTLTACRGGGLQKKVFQNGKCRKLTPLEYERLQTLPDDYTEGVADTNRYNGIGDGWTVDVITHILSHIDTSIIKRKVD